MTDNMKPEPKEYSEAKLFIEATNTDATRVLARVTSNNTVDYYEGAIDLRKSDTEGFYAIITDDSLSRVALSISKPTYEPSVKYQRLSKMMEQYEPENVGKETTINTDKKPENGILLRMIKSSDVILVRNSKKVVHRVEITTITYYFDDETKLINTGEEVKVLSLEESKYLIDNFKESLATRSGESYYFPYKR